MFHVSSHALFFHAVSSSFPFATSACYVSKTMWIDYTTRRKALWWFAYSFISSPVSAKYASSLPPMLTLWRRVCVTGHSLFFCALVETEQRDAAEKESTMEKGWRSWVSMVRVRDATVTDRGNKPKNRRLRHYHKIIAISSKEFDSMLTWAGPMNPANCLLIIYKKCQPQPLTDKDKKCSVPNIPPKSFSIL